MQDSVSRWYWGDVSILRGKRLTIVLLFKNHRLYYKVWLSDMRLWGKQNYLAINTELLHGKPIGWIRSGSPCSKASDLLLSYDCSSSCSALLLLLAVIPHMQYVVVIVLYKEGKMLGKLDGSHMLNCLCNSCTGASILTVCSEGTF